MLSPPPPPPNAVSLPSFPEPPPLLSSSPTSLNAEGEAEAPFPIDHVLSEIEKQMLEWWMEIDDKGQFVHPPKDDDELHEFIQIAYGVTIPRKVVEPGHKAPFDFVSDLYFERVRNALAFANRNGGKTWNVAILNHLDMLFKPGCEIASAGAVRDQAKKCYGYFEGFLYLPWFQDFCIRYKAATGRVFVGKQIQEETKFDTGSEQQIITATEKGLRSPHPHKARLDEIDLVPWTIFQTGLSMARSTKKIQAQNVFTSTRQLARGSMQRLLDEAPQKNIAVYEWSIWETVERCERLCFNDPEHGSCPVYTFCKGKAHHSDGFIPIDDFVDKVRLIDRTRFEVEWLNKRPARDKLVYGMFDNARHVMTPQRLFEMCGVAYPHIVWQRVSGLDFGAGPGHPFVYIKLCQLPNGAWMVFHVYAAEQRLMRDHALAIKKSPYWAPNEWIFADWAAQERLELKSMRIRTRPAVKDVLMGIDYVQSLLRGFPPAEEPMLYIWEDCLFVIGEFGLYRWPSHPDGRIDRSGKPLKVHDHAMDALRYALYSFKAKPLQKYRMGRIRGV